MKPLSDMNHYEVLEVPPDATEDDVERAYRVAAATYETDSLATYSLYEENELDAIRERIEQAYRVLASNEARESYDESLGGRPPAAPAGRVEIQLDFEAVADTRPAEVASAIDEFIDLEHPSEGSFDGARLRRTRLARGIEIDQIAQVTKINSGYLRSIDVNQPHMLSLAYSECPASTPWNNNSFHRFQLHHRRPPKLPTKRAEFERGRDPRLRRRLA